MTLDNYIMESEINDATVGDIYVEQALAEMEVAYALASSYAKDAMFVEYMAELYGVDVIQEGYYQEADDDEKVPFKERMAKLGEKAKNLGGKIKEAPGKALEFIKSVGKAILTALSNFWHFITERSLKTCIKKLHALPNELTFPVPVHLKTAVGELLEKTNKFADLVDYLIKNETSSPQKYDRQESFIKHELLNKPNMKADVSSAELVGILEELVGADVTGKVKDLVKKYKQSLKDVDKAFKDEIKAVEDKDERKDFKDSYKKRVKMDKEDLKNIKDRAKDIVSAYAQLIREFRTVANHVVKVETANMKMYTRRAKANEKADKQFNNDQKKIDNLINGKPKKMKKGNPEDATNFYGTKPTTPDSGFDDGDDVASNYNML
jgi:hypothetical protein